VAWVPVLARVSFYAGGRGGERPYWVFFAGKRWPVELFGEATVGGERPGPVERRFLLLCGERFFRVVVGEGKVRVELWVGEGAPRGQVDLLA